MCFCLFLEQGRKVLRPGALPKRNLPIKSHPSREIVARRHIDIVKERITEDSQCAYKDFTSLQNALQRINLEGWSVTYGDNLIQINFNDQTNALPKYCLIIENNLRFTIAVFNWKLPEGSHIYQDAQRSLKYLKLSKLLSKISGAVICTGVTSADAKTSASLHVVPSILDVTNDIPFQYTQYYRAPTCYVLLEPGTSESCNDCKKFEGRAIQAYKVKTSLQETAVKSRAPLTATSHSRLKATVFSERMKCGLLEEKLREMDKEIQSSSVQLDDELTTDINKIMSENLESASPFMTLFWQEQVKYFKQGSRRFHPMIIRFCLSVAAKSGSAYDELRNSGILCLPSRRTLRDYRNAIRPQVGFNSGVINELREAVESFKGHQKFVCVSFDEMKISEGLVFDKYTGELIGFTDLGDVEINEACLQKEKTLATHALLFFVRGISSDLKFPLAYFATDGITSSQILPLFWRCIAILELNVKLCVTATICDGATPNRKFFKLHKGLDYCTDSEVVYRTINVFDRRRFIFFFSDPCHLVKTARNCLFNSGSGQSSRYMWNNGKYLIWRHITGAFQADLDRGLKLLPRLTTDHIKLNSYSKMKVRLAAQVLSSSVAAVLRSFYSGDTSATADFCDNIDKFFDCLNVRSCHEHERKRKNFLKPYVSIDDERFKWLKEEFLGYLKQWKETISTRQGEFSDAAKEKMFISKQTYEGLQITAYSAVECVQQLLRSGMPYVLTERFSQDDCEEYFSCQRAIGRSSENPNMQQFGYNANNIRVGMAVSTVTGNTSGKYHGLKKKKSWYEINDSKLKKRKTKDNEKK